MTRALFRCDAAPAPVRWRSQAWDQTETITRRGSKRDLNLFSESLSHALLSRVTTRAYDVTQIGAYIYAADQMVSRGGAADIHGRKWQREMALCVPVSDPEFWNSAPVIDALRETVGFASEDSWDFSFSQAGEDELQFPLPSDPRALVHEPDSVALFSGGADSLCAAVEAVRDHGLRPVLVSHTTDHAKSARQVTLVRELRRRVPEWEFPHIVVWVHRTGSEPRDTTQRTRAFLFAAIGVAIAFELHVQFVLLADNGPVSVNLPVNDQALGTRATRSTHPKFIGFFNDLAARTWSTAPRLVNPLWTRTRCEVLRILKRHDLTALLRFTNSCAHAHRRPRDTPHCGVCSQCVDRRFATIGEQLEVDDPPARYGIDIFRDPLPSGPARTFALSYYTWALRVIRTSDDAMFDEFPQLADAIMPEDPTPTDTYLELTGMLRRQADNTRAVLKQQMIDASDELVSHNLPDTCLLRLALSPDSSYAEADHSAEAEIGPAAETQLSTLAGSSRVEGEFRHSDDYRSVTLRGRTYGLNASQAAAVRMLHEAYENGTPEMGQHTILERLELQSERLRSVFHRLDGWEELIVAGTTKGTVRLNL